jgi:hypothetical protein
MNRVRTAAWRSALDLAMTGLPPADHARAVAALVSALRADLVRYLTRIDKVQERMERASRVRHGRENLLVRSTLAAGFTLFLAPAMACYGSHGETGDDVARDADRADAGTDGADDGADDAADVPDDAVVSPDDTAGDAPCTPEDTMAERARAMSLLEAAPCPPCAPGELHEVPYGIALDAAGRIVDVRRGDGGEVPAEVRTCYLNALAGEAFPCLAGDEVWQECVICIF